MAHTLRHRRLRVACAALGLGCLAPGSFAQSWVRELSDPGLFEPRAVIEAADRTLWIAGTTDAGGDGLDGFVGRLDRCGSVIWMHATGGTGDDEILAAAETTAGTLVVAGELETAAGDSDLWLIELDAAGALVWQVRGGTADDERAHAVVPGADGGLLVVAERHGAAGRDAWLLRLDAARGIVWQQTYGGPGDDLLRDAEAVAAGGWVAAGRTDSWGAGLFDAWLVRLDEAGGVDWQYAWGGTGDDDLTSVILGGGGETVAAGLTDSFGAGLFDGWALRVDGTGTALWQFAYGGPDEDELRRIVRLDGGTAVLAGRTRSAGVGDPDGWAAALDDSGGLLWQLGYDRSGDEEFCDAVATRDGGALFAGTVGAGFDPAGWLVRTDADGRTGAGCAAESATSLAVVATTATRATTSAQITAHTSPPVNIAFSAQPIAPVETVCCTPTAGEVSPPGATEPLAFSGRQTLVWEPAGRSCSSEFNLYRGDDLAALAGGDAGSCLYGGLTAATADDADEPAPAGTFTYLVTGLTAGVEGGPGSGSSLPRILSTVCP